MTNDARGLSHIAGMTPIRARAKRRPAMTDYRSDLLRLLSTRGYIHQITDATALDALAARSVVPGYIGFDPTAPSLHVGRLVQTMLLRRLQQRSEEHTSTLQSLMRI